MSRSLLLRLFVVLALLLGNLALWGSRQASAAALGGDYQCGISSSGWLCTSVECDKYAYECCYNDGDCDF
jgi:hypothetical protein